jgi:hypothetical protein
MKRSRFTEGQIIAALREQGAGACLFVSKTFALGASVNIERNSRARISPREQHLQSDLRKLRGYIRISCAPFKPRKMRDEVMARDGPMRLLSSAPCSPLSTGHFRFPQ